MYNGIQLNNIDGPIYYPYHFPPFTPTHIDILHIHFTLGRITISRRGLRSVPSQNTTGKKATFCQNKVKGK